MTQQNQRELLEKALKQLRALRTENESLKQAKQEPIAIIGMGCRFPPSAETPEQFWHILEQGIDTVTEVPSNRWDISSYYDPDPASAGKMNTRYGTFLQNIEQFDPHFFGIAPREALSLDPQQRLLLEVCWEAIEYAGYNPEQLSGSKTGVYIGAFMTDYALSSFYTGHPQIIDAYSGLGTLRSMLAGRIAYTLNLQGPALQLDTACSSSLLAIHLACHSLRQQECHLALAGGVNLILSPENSISLSKMKALSVDGRCKAYSAQADGYGRGEGCGVVVLKRLADAQRDNDNILAIIRGSAVNHDGRSNGLTAPNAQAQEQVIQTALKQANVEPSQIQYVETHGTGTILGDPIEISALNNVLCQGRSKPYNPLFIGSVKTNVGHLESAAGIVALIKVILALQHQKIPAHLHFSTPSPHIDWEKLPITIPTQTCPWPTQTDGRLAGISSFGMSGTNVHLVVGEAPSTKRSESQTTRYQLITFSAKSDIALHALIRRYQEYLTKNTVNLSDLSFTTNRGRANFEHRVAFVSNTSQSLQEQMIPFDKLRGRIDSLRQAQGTDKFPSIGLKNPSSASLGGSSTGLGNGSKKPTRLAFLFTGQGSQYVGMGQKLYETQPLFRQILDDCEKLFQPYLEKSLLTVMFSGEETTLNETLYTQPALFALEYALAKLWQAWGINPHFVMGHSIGEYVAACLAGVFDLMDGVKLIATRGRLMQTHCKNGAMLVVALDATRAKTLIQPYPDLAIAAINGVNNSVLSGTETAIADLKETLTKQGIKTKQLPVTRAFHSPLMRTMLAEFKQVAETVTYHTPQIPIISNVTGQIITAFNADYWCQHIVEPVQFAASMGMLYQQGCETFLEIGAKPSLISMGQTCLPTDVGTWLPSLRPAQDAEQTLLESLGQLYQQGYTPNWTAFYQHTQARKIPLPTYPFQRQRYWLEKTVPLPQMTRAEHPLIGQPLTFATTKDIYFTLSIGRNTPPYLAHHEINQAIIVPAALYIELGLAVGKQLLKTEQLVLENFTLEQALRLPEEGTINLQIVLTPVELDGYTLQIFSQTHDTWTRHASGQLATQTEILSPLDIKQWRTECAETYDIETLYKECAERGLQYGNEFQTLKQLYRHPTEAIALAEISSDVQGYQLSPPLTDGCLQMAMALIPQSLKTKNFLPFSIQRLKIWQTTPPKIWCRAQLRQENPQTLTLTCQLTNALGETVAELQGVTYKQSTATKPVTQAKHRYEIAWQPTATVKPQRSPFAQQIGCWLILADDLGIAESLGKHLQKQGERCVFVYVREQYHRVDAEHIHLNPYKKEHFKQLLQESLNANYPAFRGILTLWQSPADLPTATLTHCIYLMHLLQTLIKTNGAQLPRLWVITQNAQAVGNTSTVNLAQAPLWGFGRTLQIEQPEIRCVLIDRGEMTGIREIFEEIWYPDGETQIAWRDNTRYVARLVQYLSPTDLLPTGAYQVQTTQPGALEALQMMPITRQLPQVDEVEVEIVATALNFRDVMNALNLMDKTVSDTTFGFECAGKITAVGKQVTQYQVGDEVIVALVTGALASHICVKTTHLLPKPASLSFAAASTIPLVFLTSLYALTHLAKLQRGEKILIHAAAGGVGLSAIQIAQQVGAEIFATASPGKWEHLKSLGVQHIMNSRTLDFAEEIMHLTNGAGVDVVLNSLAGEFIPKSFSVLRQGGRFIEIGQPSIGAWEEQKIHGESRDGRTYFSFDLKAILKQKPHIITALLSELQSLFEQEQLHPLPHQDFPIQEMEAAFHYLAQAKHIGKVVITQSPPSPLPIHPECSYLITGGLGALGLLTAQWLIGKGARQIALLSRHAPNPQTLARIKQLQETGANIQLLQGDVGQKEQIHQLIEQIKPPLRGIIHAAGVLDDAMLLQQTTDKMQHVLNAKVAGSWYLHECTKDLPLDFFVCYSSTAAVFGSLGQSNYAAANAFLDALAHYRRANDLPALSINWGLWENIGMATLKESDKQRLTAQGIIGINVEQGLAQLDTLLATTPAQMIVSPMNWSHYLAQLNQIPPFLENTKQGQPSSKKTADFRQELENTPLEKRYDAVLQFVQTQIAKVLGIQNTQIITLQRGFTELGMDSLTAVELRSHLQTRLACSLPATLAFDYPTLETLVNYLVREVLLIGTQPQAEEITETLDAELAHLLAEVEQLSDQEVQHRL